MYHNTKKGKKILVKPSSKWDNVQIHVTNVRCEI